MQGDARSRWLSRIARHARRVRDETRNLVHDAEPEALAAWRDLDRALTDFDDALVSEMAEAAALPPSQKLQP